MKRKTPTKSTSQKSVKHVTPDKPARNHHHILPIALSLILLLAVFIGMTHFYGISSVGKADYVTETPTLPFELDLLGSKEVAFDKVSSWSFIVTTSNETDPVQYDVQTQIAKNGALNYHVKQGSTISAQGLLDEKLLSSTPLYLDTDDQVDVTFSVANAKIRVTNGNFVEPEAAAIHALDSNKKELTSKIFDAEKEKEIKMYFTALAEAQPKLEAFWKQGTKLIPITAEFVIKETSTKNAEAEFTWTPTTDGVQTLVIKAIVGNKESTEEYRFTVGNLIYELNETNIPGLVIRKTATGYSYDITLRATKSGQPVSLPCGTFDFAFDGNEKFQSISTWDDNISQFKPGVPSEFTILESGHGYLIKLKEIEPLTLSGSCTITPLELPSFSDVPSLKQGFNLIAAKGDKSVEFSKLKTPPGMTIDATYVITNEKATAQTITELQPGKVYWVVVK
ncbi:hypothetical protein HQ489_05875 [Candidatus Woesearchaeota archaeon]|nr:hypothetical protein [Candidatus Woesearchaeota archaeon]